MSKSHNHDVSAEIPMVSGDLFSGVSLEEGDKTVSVGVGGEDLLEEQLRILRGTYLDPEAKHGDRVKAIEQYNRLRRELEGGGEDGDVGAELLEFLRVVKGAGGGNPVANGSSLL